MGFTNKIKRVDLTDNIRVHNREHLHLGLARVGGVDIPESKLIEFSLQYVYGVGRNTAKQILIDSGVNNKRTYELNENESQKLRKAVDNYITEGDLRRFHAINIKRYRKLSRKTAYCRTARTWTEN